MTTFFTMNPVGSKSPKDLSDNAENLDFLALGPAESYPDRLGVMRYSWTGFEQAFFRFLVASGFEPNHLIYVEGTPLQVDRPTQLIDYLGSVFRVKMPASFPVLLSGDWAEDEPLLVDVGDISLRQALAMASGSGMVGFSAEDTGQPVTSLLARGRKFILNGDYASEAAAAAAVALGRVYLDNRNSFTLTVGAGGNYSTLNAALRGAARMRPVQGAGLSQCVIQLRSGFVLEEQVLLTDGSDLSWIKIISVDAEVTIDPAFINTYLSPADDSIPAFGAINNSKLPVIGCLFAYASNLTSKDGVAVMKSSQVLFEPGAGVLRARRGLLIFYGSKAVCYPLGLTQGGDGTGAGLATGVNFSYARLRGLHAAYGSTGSLGRSKLHHCDGDFGSYVIWGSTVDLYQSDASYCVNGTAFHARDGGVLNCRESNGARSKRGFHALHNGRINARSRITGPTMIWIGEGAQYCSEYGVLASYNSHVEAAELNASYCGGSAAISASDSSGISFVDGVARSCANRSVWSQGASNVSAVRADVGASKIGLEAKGGGRIAAEGVKAVGCTDIGALAYGGGDIDVTGGNLSGCARAIEPRDGGEISARGANLSGCTDRAVSAIDGGRANVMEANLTNAALRAITCRGGEVVATRANCSGAGSWSVEVLDGGIVKFVGGIQGGAPMNVAPNTVTADGIIFH